MMDMANLSKHMHSPGLIDRINAMPAEIISVIVHRKPGLEHQIATELAMGLRDRDVRLPEPGQCYQFV